MADSMHIEGGSSESEATAAIQAFVRRATAREVGDEENFFESGFVTSLFGLQLISFLEESFPLVVGDDDLDIDNFSSIENIARFVRRKTGAQSPG